MECGDKIQVKFFGNFGEVAKKSSDEVELPRDATVYGLLKELAVAYGEGLRDELFAGPDRLRDDMTVTVNSAIIDRGRVREIDLNPGDMVALLPIFPGGG